MTNVKIITGVNGSGKSLLLGAIGNRRSVTFYNMSDDAIYGVDEFLGNLGRFCHDTDPYYEPLYGNESAYLAFKRETDLALFKNVISQYIKFSSEIYHVTSPDASVGDSDVFGYYLMFSKAEEFSLDNLLYLNRLSCGQIKLISLVYTIIKYELDNIIIDDIETNLSVEWQKTLLPTLASLPSVQNIVVTTHSPFIFENEFDPHAIDMEDLKGKSVEEIMRILELSQEK